MIIGVTQNDTDKNWKTEVETLTLCSYFQGTTHSQPLYTEMLTEVSPVSGFLTEQLLRVETRGGLDDFVVETPD